MIVSQELKLAVFGISVMALSSCTTISETVKPNSAHQPTSTTVRSGLDRPAFLPVENVTEGLSAELVYDLLLASIAFAQGEVSVASNALARAATSTEDPDLLARAVRMSVHSKNYTQALDIGKRWIERAKDNPQAYLITALAALLNQQEDTAFNLLFDLFEQDESLLSARFEQLGEIFIQHSEGEATVNLVEKLARQYPMKTQAWMVLAGVAQKNAMNNRTRFALAKVLGLEPDNQKAAVYQLTALADEPAAQVQFAQQFLDDNPKANEFRLQYARLLARDKNEARAVALLLEILDGENDHAEAINLLALLYQTLEDFERAKQYLERSLALEPDDTTRLYLANVLTQLKQYAEAKAELGRVKTRDALFDAKRQMVLVIEQADGVDEALAYIDSIGGENQTERIQVLVDRELLLRRAERLAEALVTLNEGLQRYPDDTTLRYHRALLQVEQKALVEHETDMRILIERKPKNAHYYNTLGYSLLTLSDRLDEAAELINKAHELKPEDPYILDSKGWLKFKQGDLSQALDFLNKAFALDQDAEIAAHIGEVYWTQGDKDKALAAWQEGDEIDAENKSLIETKARLLE